MHSLHKVQKRTHNWEVHPSFKQIFKFLSNGYQGLFPWG